MTNVLEIVLADDWGSAFSIVAMFVVVAFASHQFVKISLKAAILTIVAGVFVVNVLLALSSRLV